MKIILPKINFRIEKWKWNKEYRVYVSSLGNFKDEYKNLIPFKISQSGYIKVKTPYGFKSAHRLVMFTFCPVPNAESLTVDHKNHNKRDNSLNNLEWVSFNENQQRAKEDQILTVEEDIIIVSGKMKFTSFEEAAKWVIKEKKMGSNAKIENIIKKIQNANRQDKLYCGRKWKTKIK